MTNEWALRRLADDTIQPVSSEWVARDVARTESGLVVVSRQVSEWAEPSGEGHASTDALASHLGLLPATIRDLLARGWSYREELESPSVFVDPSASLRRLDPQSTDSRTEP